MVDLHVHSTASDGSDTPTQLVVKGSMAGLSLMALTDHDNTQGIDEFMAACREHHLRGVAGVELSADVSEGTLHIVGLGIDCSNRRLSEALSVMMDRRADRNARLFARFRQIGIDLSTEEVAAFAGADLISRVHFAQALVKRRIVGSVQEAFERYLSKDKAAYVARDRFAVRDCFEMIREAGGLPIIAHPHTWEVDLPSKIRQLKEWGLAGIEAYYFTYSAGQICDYLRLAYRFDLLTSCGSDYHGSGKPIVHLGEQMIPASVETTLMTALGHCPGKSESW